MQYHKAARLRFLSHLEVVRALERAARRAGMPYAVTQGFNPRMKVAFGPALPVGTAGEREYLDVWLKEYVPAPVALDRLVGAAPPDLAPTAARYVAAKLPSLASACTVAKYHVVLEGVDADRIRSAIGELVSVGTLSVEHKGKIKVFDLARSLPEEAIVVAEEGRSVVKLTTHMGPEGSIRPEMLLTAVLQIAGSPDATASVTRTDVLVEGEDGPTRPL